MLFPLCYKESNLSNIYLIKNQFSAMQSRHIQIRFPCSLKTEAKKSRPCWQLVPATCSVREAELGAPAVKVSLHRRANGHLKVRDSSGPGPAWVTDSVSSTPTSRGSGNCPASSVSPGKVTFVSLLPTSNIFPTWRLEPSRSPRHILRSRGRDATLSQFHSTEAE